MRLKRPTSRSIRRNAGRPRFLRWANTVEGDVPFHSTPVTSSLTEKLMSLGLVATPRRSKSVTRPG